METDMSTEPETVTLAFLARQLRRLMDDVADMRDQMTVQTAILLRLETGQRSLESRLDRLTNRVRASEEG